MSLAPPPPVAWRPSGELGCTWERHVGAAQAWLLQAQAEGTVELLDANDATWHAHLSCRFSYLYYTSAAHPTPTAEKRGLVLSSPAAAPPPTTPAVVFSPPPRGDEARPPESLRLGHELGRGAFASVHSARVGEHQFALKRSLRACPSWNESLHRDEHFLRALAGHEGVASLVSTYWDASGLRCLLMPMAKGDLHRERPPDLPVFEGVVRQLARAFRHIHGRGVVHMDLKPQNVLVFQPHWVVRVADFGSSLRRGHGLDGEKLYECTRPYRAPELLTVGPKTARPSMDLWALGVLSWDIYPGERMHPLAGAQNSAEQAVLVVALVGCEARAAETWGLQGVPELAPLPRGALGSELRWATDTLLRPLPQERTLAPLLRRRQEGPAPGGGPAKVEKTRNARETVDEVEEAGDRGAVA